MGNDERAVSGGDGRLDGKEEKPWGGWVRVWRIRVNALSLDLVRETWCAPPQFNDGGSALVFPAGPQRMACLPCAMGFVLQMPSKRIPPKQIPSVAWPQSKSSLLFNINACSGS